MAFFQLKLEKKLVIGANVCGSGALQAVITVIAELYNPLLLL
jgi:hypothetical protein